MLQHLLGGTDFDESAGAHDRDARGNLRDDRQAMRDKNVSEGKLALQFSQEKKNLCTDGDIQSRDRFVGNNKLRLEDQGARDANPLPLPTGKFMGVTIEGVGAESDPRQHQDGAISAFPGGEARLMNREGLGDDFANTHPRIQ